jgi:hypothetical protein
MTGSLAGWGKCKGVMDVAAPEPPLAEATSSAQPRGECAEVKGCPVTFYSAAEGAVLCT